MLTKQSQKIPKKYVCENCDYNTCNIKDYNKHLLTRKHKMLTNVDKTVPKKPEYMCEDCGKLYKYRQSLHVHKQKCSVKNTIDIRDIENSLTVTEKVDYKDLLMQAMKQMQEQHEEMKKKDELMAQMIDKIGNTTNNTTNNMNNFNINMFLNEQCKNAINLSDFIERIEVSHDDLENNAQLGFVKGMTKIIMDNLKMLTIHERPIHCTDVKRETLYIKDQDVWEKDNSDKKLESAIQEVSRKSMGSLLQWKQTNPEYQDLDSDFSNLCMAIQRQSIAANNRDSFYPKIIHNLAKENTISELKTGTVMIN